mmetsp:Transcript_19065/g.55438  ORF Transcript_19065/g.55438 Transcript_19065/m.55438 type:complete len:167 (-) Transcript_19065:188-688(-)
MSAASGSFTVFAYGSLAYERVLMALLQRVPATAPARLHGFSRHGLEARAYPAITRAAGGQFVDGLLLQELSAQELDLLDFFEDDEYNREELSVSVLEGAGSQSKELPEGGTDTVSALVYVWNDDPVSLKKLQGPWLPEEVFLPQIEEYVRMCTECRDEYFRSFEGD